MKVPPMGIILAVLLILVLVLYFGLGFFGDSVVEDDVTGLSDTLATGGTLVTN